ncbi:DUF298-domain-containing protein [Marasmius fiardii PR-910]|nr:DUF298-domain-containing protein [Marasmius fiardii PR-910]
MPFLISTRDITTDGTIKFCEDLGVDPEDVVLLVVAYELKSTKMAEWNKKGWTEGWKALGCDSISAMQAALPRLRNKLGSDRAYFRKVYLHAFEFARAEGQRSLPIDSAQGFWALLLPHGLSGGALARIPTLTHNRDKDGDVSMGMASSEGWKEEYTTWWFEYLTEKKTKGVSRDTWSMFLDFVTTIDSKFETYNAEEEAWPSLIDEFVEYARAKIQNEQ